MVRKLLKREIAEALGLSDSMVSRYVARGMPYNDRELARRWYDANVSLSLRKAARYGSPPAASVMRTLTPDELADVLLAAGPAIAANLIVEAGLAPDQAGVAFSCVTVAVHTELEQRNVESPLWEIGAPAPGSPAAAAWDAQVVKLAAQLRAEYAAIDAAEDA